MDIHRCRFVPYPPSAINAVAFSHTGQTKKSTPLRLAIGRANGDIEIWNPLNGSWHQETTLYGGKDRSIDGLVWVNEPDQVLDDGRRIVGKSRLFSIGYTSTVTEWDIEKGRPRKQASGAHGDIWCLGAQPVVASSKMGKKLVAGTMDGSLVLYSIDDDDIRFDRILVRSHTKKTKMVSIAFQNRNIFAVGCSDSAVRVYDIRSGQMLRKMTLGSDLAGGAKEIIVWSVKCLNGGDIVSGDSTGQVCIWDGKTYTQAQRLQTHKQDVLSLVTSADGQTIVSGGMDRKTVFYRKTRGSGDRWARVWHRRYHKHDVKTMASFEGHGMSVVVSGGPDATPVVMPLEEAGMENHRTLSYLPQNPPVRSALKSRMVLSWWDREVYIWRLKKSLKEMTDLTGGDSGAGKNHKLLARILIKGEANITSATISEDGSLLIVATTSDIKAFHLSARKSATKDELKIAKLDVPETIAAPGATLAQISPDGNWLCLIQDGQKPTLARVLRDEDPESRPAIHPKAIRIQRITRKIPKHIVVGGLQQYDRTITHVAFSPDSRMLAVADLAGYLDTWVFQESATSNGVSGADGDDMSADDSSDSDVSEAEEGPRWARNPNASLIPKLVSAVTVLSFSNQTPGGSVKSVNGGTDTADDYILLAVAAKPQLLVINPLRGSLTPWSRRNTVSQFPLEYRNVRDLAKGALWADNRVWLYGHSFLFMLDLDQDVAVSDPTDASSAVVRMDGAVVKHGQKRKRGPDHGAGNKMEKGAIGPTRILRHQEGEGAEELPLNGQTPEPMDTDATSAPGEDSEEDDSEAEAHGDLALLRGAERQKGPEAPSGQGRAFWYTYKFRPILGIVPVGEPVYENGDKAVAVGAPRQPLEVALIERPIWDTDMPDRYGE